MLLRHLLLPIPSRKVSSCVAKGSNAEMECTEFLKGQGSVIPNKEDKPESWPQDPALNSCDVLGLRQLWGIRKRNEQEVDEKLLKPE